MNTQNILKYYGSKLDIKLDHSEFYDLEIAGVNDDYDFNLLELSTPITYSSLVVDSNCLTGSTLNDIKPWIINIDEDTVIGDCNFNVRRRTENGWTLDFIFNKNGLDWTNGKVFYYWGVDNSNILIDNFLRFSFTSTGSINWESLRYSGYCDTVSGYTETSYLDTGNTLILPLNETQDDFNITITFERYNGYELCELPNEGGWNDLITGVTIINSIDVITGATEVVSSIEVLNEKFNNEREKRMGVLKIYLNGKIIYKKENFMEIIPSKRDTNSDLIQKFGGDLINNNCEFEIKQVKYFEEPLNFLQVKHHFTVNTSPLFNITNTNVVCVDDLLSYFKNGLLTEGEINLITEDNNILLF